MPGTTNTSSGLISKPKSHHHHSTNTSIFPLPPHITTLLTHLHPILLLSTYSLNFDNLVHGPDPVDALVSGLWPLVVIQVGYAITCLESVGGGTTGVKKGSKLGGGGGGGGGDLSSPSSPSPSLSSTSGSGSSSSANPLWQKFLPTALSLILTTLLSLPILTTLLILFGAPVTTHLPHTTLCAAHLSLLTTFPLLYVHQVSPPKWKSIISATLPLDEVFGASVGALLGAWAGAVPIPLDWDREWQRWPVTVITGGYVGYVVGKVIGGWVVKGKRIA